MDCKNIAIIHIGKIAYQTRLLKQIRTLQSVDYNITVFVGNELYYGAKNDNVDSQAFNFKTVNYKVWQGRTLKIITFINLLKFNLKIGRNIAKGNFDYVICEELNTLLSGVIAKIFRKNIKLIFDNNELSVERYSGIKKPIYNFIQKKCVPYCDIIIHAEINRLKYFQNKYNLSHKTQFLIENFPYSNEGHIYVGNIERGKKVIYLGAITPNRCIKEIVDSFKRLPDFSLDIVGFGSDDYLQELTTYIKDIKAINVSVLPPVQPEMIPQLLLNYSIGIATYMNSNLNNYYCAPNKIYQYLHSGLAVITNNYPGLIDVIEKNKIGCCIGKIDAESIQAAAEDILLYNYNHNITPSLLVRFSWEYQIENYLNIFRKL